MGFEQLLHLKFGNSSFIYAFKAIHSVGIKVFILFLVLRDRVSLCSSDYLGTRSIDQTSLELKMLYLPASAAQVLGLKACTTAARLIEKFLKIYSSLCQAVMAHAFNPSIRQAEAGRSL